MESVERRKHPCLIEKDKIPCLMGWESRSSRRRKIGKNRASKELANWRQTTGSDGCRIQCIENDIKFKVGAVE